MHATHPAVDTNSGAAPMVIVPFAGHTGHKRRTTPRMGVTDMQRVQDLMTSNPAVIETTDSAAKAAASMLARGTGLLAVLDGDQVVGVVTDRDLTTKVV